MLSKKNNPLNLFNHNTFNTDAYVVCREWLGRCRVGDESDQISLAFILFLPPFFLHCSSNQNHKAITLSHDVARPVMLGYYPQKNKTTDTVRKCKYILMSGSLLIRSVTSVAENGERSRVTGETVTGAEGTGLPYRNPPHPREVDTKILISSHSHT